MISQNVIEFAKLEAILFDTPEAINTKLDVIKEALSSGDYQINSKNIAGKLLEYAPITEAVETVY